MPEILPQPMLSNFSSMKRVGTIHWTKSKKMFWWLRVLLILQFPYFENIIYKKKQEPRIPGSCLMYHLISLEIP
jgi:hypothetical protein